MKKIVLLIIFVLLDGALTVGQDITDEKLVALDAMLTEMSEQSTGEFNGTFLVALGDEIIFSQGYGYAVTEWEIPNAIDTVFRVGSITKQFTGIAILKLQEEGLLDVDDSICDYLEDCPDTLAEVTIWHLLTHTSGVFNYMESRETFAMLQAPQTSVNDITASFIHMELQFESGSEWQYNNSNYHLLGEIIAAASGISYERYLNNSFFNPFEMTDTQLENPFLIIPRMAEGYKIASQPAAYLNMMPAYSAGGLISTVEDLFRWQRALWKGQIVSQDSLDTMWERAFDFERGGFSYAYGVTDFPVEVAGEMIQTYDHGGGINGFSSYMTYLPEYDMTFIALANRERFGASSAVDTAIFQAYEILLGESE